jgi:heme/copper-type cytochrome/quinol oxidase subunit 2
MLSWLPQNIGSYGQDVDWLFHLIYYITAATFILVAGAMVTFLILHRHREGRRATYTHGNSALEIVWGVFLPNLRFKQDAVPGREVVKWVQATKPGKYEIPCAELCGFGHPGMKGSLYVHAPEEFEQWMKQAWAS